MQVDKRRVAHLLAPLLCAYPAAKISMETIQVYAVALSVLTEDQLQAAVLRCMRTCKFFPSIAEIMEAADEITDVTNSTRLSDEDEAWQEVLQQVHDAFVYRKPKFSRPEIEQAAMAMGWIALCEMPADQVATNRAQFLRLYKSICQRKRNEKVNNEVIMALQNGKGVLKAIASNSGRG